MKNLTFLLMVMVALLFFSACSGKEPVVKYVLTPCPHLQEFNEVNGSVESLVLEVDEVANTIQSMEAVKAKKYNDLWLVNKVQVENLVFYVKDVKNRLFDSLTLNRLYKEQISEYNDKYTKKGNAWQKEKE